MWRKARTACFGALLALTTVITPATAGSVTDVKLFLSSAALDQALPYSAFGYADPNAGAQVDFALFATELTAFLMKEVVSDSREEYKRSPLGSRWSQSMPKQRSEFGTHCLMIVGRVGAAMPRLMPGSSSLGAPSAMQYAARAATAGLALRQIWRAFEHDVKNERSGVSLNPKVSSRRIGVNVTLHW